VTTMLRPAYSLTIGSQVWTQQALEIDLHLASAPQAEQLIVRLPAAAPLDAGPDDQVTLELDGGEGSSRVFGGVVASVSRRFHTVVVKASGALARMARYRPAITFENVTSGTVIEGLASDAGIPTGTIEDGVMLAYYAADPSRTALEHAARVAAWSGAQLTSDSDGAVCARIINAASAETALLHGREIIDLSIEEGPEPETVTVAGESGASSDSAPEALRPTTDAFAGNRPPGPGLGEAWFFEPALRTASAMATAGAARQRMLSSAQQCGRMETFLLPGLRPGTVVELKELPTGMSGGPFWLSDVRHRLSPAGATTVSQLRKGGDNFNPLALLGSLGGALGVF